MGPLDDQVVRADSLTATPDGLDHRERQAPVVGHPHLDDAAGAAVVPGAEALLADDVLVEHQ